MNQEQPTTALPNNGASNAADFQPPTQNPQMPTTSSVYQPQSGLSSATNTQSYLNEQQNARITVTTEPAPAKAKANETNDAVGIAIGLVILVVIVIFVVRLLASMNKAKKDVDTAEVPIVEDVVEVEPTTPTETVKSTESTVKPPTKNAKNKAKNKAAKKAKRKRR